MKTVKTNTINIRGLRAGDVLSVRRKIGYKHFGIYAGNGKVIHFSGSKQGELNPKTADIIKTDLEAFSRGDYMQIENSVKRDCREVIMARAEKSIGTKKGTYNLAKNNCEHFARWCETGIHKSEQVDQVKRFVRRQAGGETLVRILEVLAIV